MIELSLRGDSRQSPRRIVHIPAIMIFNAGRSRLPCVIRNLSQGGARLEITFMRNIPRTFDLLFDGKLQPCRVIWRALRELGVAFD